MSLKDDIKKGKREAKRRRTVIVVNGKELPNPSSKKPERKVGEDRDR